MGIKPYTTKQTAINVLRHKTKAITWPAMVLAKFFLHLKAVYENIMFIIRKVINCRCILSYVKCGLHLTPDALPLNVY